MCHITVHGMATARGELRTVAAITTPCSVRAKGRYRCPPRPKLEIAICDLKAITENLDGGNYAGGQTATYSAVAVCGGTGRWSSFNPSRWKEIASRILRSTARFVFPVATQPGRSGQYAEKLPSAFSMTTRYLLILIRLVSRYYSTFLEPNRARIGPRSLPGQVSSYA